MFSGLHDSALYQSHPLFLETWCFLSINSLGVLESTTAAAPKTSLQNIIYLLVLVGHVVRNGVRCAKWCTFALLARIVFMMQRMKDLLLHQGLALPSEFKINLKISRRHLTGYVKEMFLNMWPATDHVF